MRCMAWMPVVGVECLKARITKSEKVKKIPEIKAHPIVVRVQSRKNHVEVILSSLRKKVYMSDLLDTVSIDIDWRNNYYFTLCQVKKKIPAQKF